MNRTRSIVVLSFVVVLAALLTLSRPASAVLAEPPSVSERRFAAGSELSGSGDGGRHRLHRHGLLQVAVICGGTTTAWSNDGTSTVGSEPTAAVTLTVTNGLFNVLLGDTTLTNMTALPASAFNGTDRALRVWFSRDGATFTLLSPDRRIAAVPYALQAN